MKGVWLNEWFYIEKIGEGCRLLGIGVGLWKGCQFL